VKCPKLEIFDNALSSGPWAALLLIRLDAWRGRPEGSWRIVRVGVGAPSGSGTISSTNPSACRCFAVILSASAALAAAEAVLPQNGGTASGLITE
jgi:hypothetical protein